VGVAWRRPTEPPLLRSTGRRDDARIAVLDEAESKALLGRWKVPFPPGRVVRGAREAAAAADEIGPPLAVKVLGVAHKTEAGGVRLDLRSAEEVTAAVTEMSHLSDSFLIEKTVHGAVAELIVGVARDEQFGPYLLVGSGGILVELMKDTATILLPTTRERVLDALGRLKCAPLLYGFRAAPPADLNAAVEVILAIASMVESDPTAIVEVDINPLMLMAEGHGVVAADALVSLSASGRETLEKGSGR